MQSAGAAATGDGSKQPARLVHGQAVRDDDDDEHSRPPQKTAPFVPNMGQAGRQASLLPPIQALVDRSSSRINRQAFPMPKSARSPAFSSFSLSLAAFAEERQWER